MNTFIFSIELSKGYQVGVSLAILISEWRIPGLNNLEENRGRLKVKTRDYTPEDVIRMINGRTKGNVKLTLTHTFPSKE